MINFNTFYQHIVKHSLVTWLDSMQPQLSAWYEQQNIPRLTEWLNVIDRLPILTASHIDLKNTVQIESKLALHHEQHDRLLAELKKLSPWRKGPYSLYGIHIDTEWRSDWKWDRLINHIQPLVGKTVLDVGCNNGYHLWRMIGEGAKLAIGIDPMPLYFCQFRAISKLFNHDPRVHFLPLGIEQLPVSTAFDTVFSMGILYHRRSPLDHLMQLKDQLIEGGQLVLETLIIEGDDTTVLVPEDRYAKMRNVYFIPSISLLQRWLARCGFINSRLVDVDQTSLQEQRKTEWMTSDSLENFLDSSDHTKTIEGYPAPRRAIIIAEKPD